MRTLVFLLAALCACSGGDVAPPVMAPTGNFTLIAFDATGDMYRLDPGTAARNMLLDTSYNAADIGPVGAACAMPGGGIWIGGGGQSNCVACVLALDTGTGQATLLFDNATALNAVPDLALRASDGALFTTQANGRGFYSVDNTTGQVSQISATTASNNGNGLAFIGPAETLHLCAGGLLCTVNPASGADGVIAVLAYAGFPAFTGTARVVSMTENPDTREVHVLVKDAGGTGTTHLATLDTATGIATYIGMTTSPMDGLAWVPVNSVP